MKSDQENQYFWDELCGTSLARGLGITDSSAASLKKFDNWYFDFYPYLEPMIDELEVSGKRVLEVGLGFGSVSQLLGEKGAVVTALDVAKGPVDQAAARFKNAKVAGRAVQGSILDQQFVDQSFELVVAIGSLHHTGDLRRSVNQCARLLKPGGQLFVMVYNAFSYRRLLKATGPSILYFLRQCLGFRGVVGHSTPRDRKLYDADSSGKAAPHTDWISSLSLKHLLKDFDVAYLLPKNIDVDLPFTRKSRPELLETWWARKLGLDLYALATKRQT